jgi:Neuraminidase (sialidase)
VGFVSRIFCLFSLLSFVLVSVQCGSDSNSSPVMTTARCDSGTSASQPVTSAPAIFPLVRLSADTFTNSTSQHATEVEPDSFAWGQTIVAAFQVGRINDGGAADIGYAISNNGGATWRSGMLPGLTTFECSGTNSAVSDAAVIYDAAHSVWLISALPISATNIQVAVNRSTDGGATWSKPVIVANGANLDKDWMEPTNDQTQKETYRRSPFSAWITGQLCRKTYAKLGQRTRDS